MKIKLPLACIFMFCSLILSSTASAENNKVSPVDMVTTYRNHLQVTIADPFILKYQGQYYLYGTTSSSGLETYVSDDLIHWTSKGYCYKPTEKSWGQREFWAPEVIEKNSKFYIYFSARQRSDKQRNICVAVADSPLGPFKDLKAPLLPDLSVIDGHVFADPATSETYLYVVDEHESPSRILGGRLNPDMTSFETSLTTVLKPSMPWEDYWNEAPFVIKHGSTYYMMYSGSAFWEPGYAVGYAEGPTPLGPFVKYKGNPILRATATVDGPGHNAVISSPDGSEMFIVYHTHAGHWTTERTLAIDRLKFITDDHGHELLTVPGGATSTDQPLPSGVAPWRRAVSDSFDGTHLVPRQWTILNESKDNWNLGHGALNIKLDEGDYWRTHENGTNTFLQDVPHGNFAISTEVKFDKHADGAQASLVIWDDVDNFVMFGPGDVNGNKYVLSSEVQQKNDTSLFPSDASWPGKVRMECHGHTISFFTGKPGGGWSLLKKKIKIRFKPQYVGLAAWTTEGNSADATASFNDFKVTPLP